MSESFILPTYIYLKFLTIQSGNVGCGCQRCLRSNIRSAEAASTDKGSTSRRLALHLNIPPNKSSICLQMNYPESPEVIRLPTNSIFSVQHRRPESQINHPDDNIPVIGVQYYSPGQFALKTDPYSLLYKTITHLSFSPNGTELLVNMGTEQIYLYDLNDPRQPLVSIFAIYTQFTCLWMNSL